MVCDIMMQILPFYTSHKAEEVVATFHTWPSPFFSELLKTPWFLKKILFLFHMLRELEEEGKSLQIAIFDRVQYIAPGLKLSF